MQGQTMRVCASARMLVEVPSHRKSHAVQKVRERVEDLLERAQDPNDPDANELLDFLKSNIRIEDVYTEGEFEEYRPDQDFDSDRSFKIGGTDPT